MRLPTRGSVFVIVVAIALRPRLRRGGPDGVYDVLIARAPAEIALEAMPDFVIRRIRMVGQKLLRRHDHARRAEAALQAVLVPEGLLDGVELAVRGGQSFDGQDV